MICSMMPQRTMHITTGANVYSVLHVKASLCLLWPRSTVRTAVLAARGLNLAKSHVPASIEDYVLPYLIKHAIHTCTKPV
jgi:hypothetical protein